MIVEVNKGLFSEYAQSGRGPVYMDCRGISDRDYAYMMHWFGHEGFTALVNHLNDKGIDLRKQAIEWATYGMRGKRRQHSPERQRRNLREGGLCRGG